jgi:hypothetical protein
MERGVQDTLPKEGAEMIDIDKLEQAALAANANGDVTLQIVLELINRLRTAEKSEKSWDDQAIREMAKDKQNAD